MGAATGKSVNGTSIDGLIASAWGWCTSRTPAPELAASSRIRSVQSAQLNIVGSAEVDIENFVLAALGAIHAQHRFHARQRVVFVQPDLGVFRVKTQQDQLAIHRAVQPRCDERIPKAIDHRAVSVDDQEALDARDQAMALGNERCDGAS